jgi:hypothetical protein
MEAPSSADAEQGIGRASEAFASQEVSMGHSSTSVMELKRVSHKTRLGQRDKTTFAAAWSFSRRDIHS